MLPKRFFRVVMRLRDETARGAVGWRENHSSLKSVIAEIHRWIETGRSCFHELLDKLKLTVPQVSILDRIAQGFRNRDVRTALSDDARDPRHRRSAAVGRLLKRLHVRGFVLKVPRTRRWRVTDGSGQDSFKISRKGRTRCWRLKEQCKLFPLIPP